MAAAFNVQNDTGTTEAANAYVSLDYFKQYHLDRGNIVPNTDGPIQTAIVRATDYLDTRFAFDGSRLADDQTTEWPRQCAYDCSGVEFAGIPDALKKAVCEYALRAISAALLADMPAPDGGRAIRRERVKVDVIETETEYEPGQPSSPVMPAYPAADLLLVRACIIRQGGGLVIR